MLKCQKQTKEYIQEVKKQRGGCEICGYNKCLDALDFHHLYDDKDNNLNYLWKTGNIDRVKQEVSKCIVLCANCHRETHAWITNIVVPIMKAKEEALQHQLELRGVGGASFLPA